MTVGEWALGLLARVIAPAWRAARLRFRQPHLSIFFDANKTYDVAGPPECRRYYCHFHVRNTGKDTAKACRSRLMSVSSIEGEGERPVPKFHAPRTLKWDNVRGFARQDIEPGLRAHRSDLCYGERGSPLLVFYVDPEERGIGVQTSFPRGYYRVRVRVESENADPADATFDVRFSGVWNEIIISDASVG